MKRGLGVALAGIGAFLLATGLLLKFVAVPKLEVAPLAPGTDGISTSINKGVATKLFYPGKLATGENPTRENVPLTATRTTRGDVLAATSPEAEAQNLAVYDSFQNVTDDEGTTIDANTLRIAFNRTTSELTNCCGVNIDGEQANFTGIAPLKFPFNTEQKDYDWYDTGQGKTVPAKFEGVENREGVELYKFSQKIEPHEVGELDVPGSLVGSTEASVKAKRFSETETVIWVEPITGQIVDGAQKQHQYLAGADGTTEALTIIQAEFKGEPAEAVETITSAGKTAGLLKTLSSTVPLVAGLLGVIGLILGFFLATRPKDSSGDDDAAYAPGTVPPTGNVDLNKPAS